MEIFIIGSKQVHWFEVQKNLAVCPGLFQLREHVQGYMSRIFDKTVSIAVALWEK